MQLDEIRSKVCVSVAERCVQACLEVLTSVTFAEVRLDAIESMTAQQVRLLFEVPARLVATCRPESVDDGQRCARLICAIEAGARYVDVELDSEAALQTRVIQAAKRNACDVIISHHDYDHTPPRNELESLINACFDAGADVAKIACAAKRTRDSARLLGLLDDERRLVVIGMGEPGVVTRVMGPVLGGEFTFASLREGAQTAPGQLCASELERRIAEVIGSPLQPATPVASALG